jgi:LCP family protein required for cell wall assembly
VATPARARAIPRYRPLSRSQRALFVVALFTFGIAMCYTSVAVLTRVWPAVFPGKEFSIPGVHTVLGSLPGPAQVEAPGPTSIFNKRINLLIIGVDKRGDFEETVAQPYNTDTLMVATIDPNTSVISLVSFPRDLWIQQYEPGATESHWWGRINSSFADGVKEGHTLDAGADRLAYDIKMNFGIETDYYVWMDFKGVERLIDALGGIDINIPEELAVPSWWYTDDDRTNPHWEEFPPGPQHLTGYQAVAFGRYRNDSDLYRVKRQQLVVQTALQQSFSTGILSRKAEDLWDAYNGFVKHNVPVVRFPGLFLLLKEGGGQMQTYSLGDQVDGRDTVFGRTTEGGAAVLDWDPDNVRAILGQAFTKSQYAKSSVEVANGHSAGAEGENRIIGLGKYLKWVKGLPVVGLGPDVEPQPETTITLFTPDRRPMAEDIAGWLGLPLSAIHDGERTSPSQPDILIVIGRDFDLPPDY